MRGSAAEAHSVRPVPTVTNQVEAYAVEERGRWLVITVIVKYF